jgi:hypothetical protein
MKEFYSTEAERRLTLRPTETAVDGATERVGRPEIVLERSIARRIFLQVDGQS